jgi:enolase
VTFHALKGLLEARGFATGVGDEGGFAPDLAKDEDACVLIVEAIEKAGFKPGEDIAIALDPAASSFFADGAYQLPTLGGPKTSDEMIALYEGWISRFPIVLIEDGLAEEDWSGFQAQTRQMGERIDIMGDDLYVTNPAFIRRGIEAKTTNSVLIKLNQIGTVTETIEAVELCRQAGWRFMVSHRSGETIDSFIADFAVAMGGGQLKAGSLSRGERLAKYNRLLEIERELEAEAQFSSPFPRA